MYVIIEEHIGIRTGEVNDVTPSSKDFGREEYDTYEECVERIEKFLIPHAIGLGIFDDEIDYNEGTEINYEDESPVRWKVLRSEWYHTMYTIKKF